MNEWRFRDFNTIHLHYGYKDNISQGARAGRGFNELLQEVRHRQGGWGHSLDHPPYSDKSQNLGFLRKSIF